ncbi:uncharacterized protein LOC119466241 isoform X1 [Dermacentor silvarum]|uniref:uncharacterized protein LOC119466241 isoform X1 n=3 Tax=Dermacentor silvarum TaxID=543639 RepID=UPI00189BB05C|nr:uncharacterized protein LOC119466241 isoform X1 [Dermacentor silvarum]
MHRVRAWPALSAAPLAPGSCSVLVAVPLPCDLAAFGLCFPVFSFSALTQPDFPLLLHALPLCFLFPSSVLSLHLSAQAMARQRSNSSEAMVKFLKDRVESNQGISLQKLTGHLSQLPSDLRTKYGCSVKSLKIFLQQFPKVFVIRNQSNVYVRTKSRRLTTTVPSPTGSMESFPTSNSDRGTDDDDATCLTNVVGTVYRIFNVYGFIAVKYPIKTSVYFDVQAFENGEHSNLPSSGLQVNDTVILDAKAGPRECEAKFRASRVARIKGARPSSTCSSPIPHSVSGSCGGGGGSVRSSSTSQQIVNQDGVIETVKANYGFIKFGRNQRERAFFHSNNVDRSLGRSIKNLPDVFTVDDKVRFNAKPSKKPSDKVKWEATTVYLTRRSGREGTVDTDDESGNEVFMSDDESDIQDILHDKDTGSCDADIDESPIGYPDWDSNSARADFSDTSIQGKLNLISSTLSGWEARRKLSGERGFFYPESETTGTIKFGIKKANVASATVDVTFRDKEPLDNLLWEVGDGQEVCFDAVDAGDNEWVATLVWMGQRPAVPHVGDSEDIFNKIVNKGIDTHGEEADCVQESQDDFGEESALRGASPLSPPHTIQPSVSIYENAKAIILKSMECIAKCEVNESGAFRKIDFTSDCFYKDGSIFLGDLNEVLHQGSTVCLDYMVGINRKGQEIVRCDLVWQGRRPRGVRQLSPEEFSQRLRRDLETVGNTSSFEDFGPEVDREEEQSHTPSRVPSDEAVLEDDEPCGLSGSSSSTSMTGVPPDPSPNVTSPIHFAHIPGSPSGGCGDAPGASFFMSDVNDDVLHRLAKMVAAEITAERERTRIVLRDIGVQTSDEDRWLSTSSRAYVKAPTLVNSSTQTLSTGNIKSEELFIN